MARTVNDRVALQLGQMSIELHVRDAKIEELEATIREMTAGVTNTNPTKEPVLKSLPKNPAK